MSDVVHNLADILRQRLSEYDADGSYASAYNDIYRQDILSDVRDKTLARLASKDKLTVDDLMTVAEYAGKYNGRSILDESDTDWDESMLQGYADHLRNYLYTYKDSAKLADPRIDTAELHNGPMAQDIEQVAPDCVNETSDGIKTVDGNRLALVNAGVLGDVIRKLNAIERRLEAGGL